jgi:hypothetical protein
MGAGRGVAQSGSAPEWGLTAVLQASPHASCSFLPIPLSCEASPISRTLCPRPGYGPPFGHSLLFCLLPTRGRNRPRQSRPNETPPVGHASGRYGRATLARD